MERRVYDLSPENAKRIEDAGSVTMLEACAPENIQAAQDRVNEVWKQLGDEMGFVWDTARPVVDHGQMVENAVPTQFSAIPKEDHVDETG